MAAETAPSVSKGSCGGGLGVQKDGDHCPGTKKKDFWTFHHRRKMILAIFGASSIVFQPNIAQNSQKMCERQRMQRVCFLLPNNDPN